MKKVSLLGGTTAVSILATAAIATPAFAWHPKGVIQKEVQDQTLNSASVDANDVSGALMVNSGDTLVYTIKVSNTGAPAANGDDDMANTVMTDTLPAGIELVSNPSQRTITENLGTIKPGQTVTKTYAVKITGTKDGDIVTNRACFTGNSLVNDNPQSGCDVAIVKVHVPTTPTPTPTPTPQPTPPALPNTGSTALTATFAVATAAVIGYALNVLRLKRRTSANS